MLKAALKTALRPIRTAGGRFFIHTPDTIIWKAAQISVAELIEGDYLEFGVFRGHSFIQAFSTIRTVHRDWSMERTHSPEHRARLQKVWNKMRFFAFDSFQGLPEPDGLDRHTSDFAKGHYAYAMDNFLNDLERSKVDLEKVVAVPGWFEDTCTEETIKKYNMKAASIVHIDCDLYESAKTVLRFIEPLLVDGTVLIFDDWYCFRGNPELGEQRAFREWTQGKPDWLFTEYQKEGATRNSFIANRKIL
ncbi:MAG: TylF/MycF/NovP-related O-methyltransferase [Terriglobia bacterium]